MRPVSILKRKKVMSASIPQSWSKTNQSSESFLLVIGLVLACLLARGCQPAMALADQANPPTSIHWSPTPEPRDSRLRYELGEHADITDNTMSRKRSAKLLSLKEKAKREGWLAMIRSEADERAVLDGYYFDAIKAAHAVEFFPRFLCHAKNEYAGQPFELLAWQRDDLIAPLFGWQRPSGIRRYTRAYIEIPKKNGKSTLAAGVGLYLATADGEVGNKVFCAATDKLQAKIVYGECVAMVEQSPLLKQWCKVNKSDNTITHTSTRSVLTPLSQVVNSKEGLDGSAIIDELHAWEGWDLWDCLKYMGSARRQPMLFVITTAGEDQEGPCYAQHSYAMRLISGKTVDHRFFPLVYGYTREQLEAGEKKWDTLRDPKTHAAVNPSYGFTIKPEEFAADIKEAIDRPAELPRLLRYKFNVWIRSESAWLSQDLHDSNFEDFSPDDLAGHDCHAGLDLAKVMDLTALSLMFKDPNEEELYRRMVYYFIPEKRVWDLRDQVHFALWAANPKNNLIITDGDVCDYARIAAKFRELTNQYNILDFAYDPWNAENLTQDLETDTGVSRVEFGQTLKNFCEPCDEYERLLLLGRMRHNGNELLGWQTSHVRVRCDVNNNKRPVKPHKGKAEDYKTIDGVVADLMALGRWIQEPESDYDGSALVT